MSDEREHVLLIDEIVLAEAEQDWLTDMVGLWVSRNPRMRITMDELVLMTNIVPRLEAQADRWFTDRGVSRRPFIFTVDGTLHGTRMVGNTLGGDPIFVLAPTENAAREQAAQGIERTIQLAIESFARSLAPAEPAGIERDVGGRRMGDREADNERLRQSSVFMRVRDALSSTH